MHHAYIFCLFTPFYVNIYIMETVKIYTTHTCPYCFALAEWLEELGVQFEEHSASELSDVDMVPVLIIGEDKLVGFDRPAILRVLKKHQLINA